MRTNALEVGALESHWLWKDNLERGVTNARVLLQNQCLTLDRQIEYFSRVRAALQQKLGDVETKKHLSRSIFVVVIGSNDLLGYFKSDPSEQAKSTPQQLVDSLIFKLKGQLKVY